MGNQQANQRVRSPGRLGAILDGRSYEERLADFRTSDDWLYLKTEVLDSLDTILATARGRIVTLIILSRGMSGMADYATVFGDMPPERIIRSLLHSHESFVLQKNAARDLFDANIASLSDYMSVALGAETGSFEDDIRSHLHRVFIGRPPEAPLMEASISAKLVVLPSIRQGLDELNAFYNQHLKQNVLDPNEWSWADIAHIALIYMTSIQWQHRLFKLYGHRLTQSVLVSLAEGQMNKHPVHITESDDETSNLTVETHSADAHVALRLALLRSINQPISVV